MALYTYRSHFALPVINTKLFTAARKNMLRRNMYSERAGKNERNGTRKKFGRGKVTQVKRNVF